MAVVLLKLFLFLLCLKLGKTENSTYLPRITPFLPQISPSPFVNRTIPKLSGKCMFNFTSADTLMKTTAVDCYGASAPLLKNAICCPQVEATLTILVAQSSLRTSFLSLNESTSKHCLSDFNQLLAFHGVTYDVTKLCSVSEYLTETSCPVTTIDEVEKVVDSRQIVKACTSVDPVRECCEQTCQNAALYAASKLSSGAFKALKLGGSPQFSPCKDIILRWVAAKLDSSSAKGLLRILSNCDAYKVCPLVLPSARFVSQQCEGKVVNKSSCCNATENYLMHLRKQMLITNLQAMHCADSLAMKLRSSNVSSNVFKLCQVKLKDFSLQVQSREYGCLLPSMPLDATLDKNSGVSFTCDLNENILAPWEESISLCSQSVIVPALPVPASSSFGIGDDWPMGKVLIVVAAIIGMIM